MDMAYAMSEPKHGEIVTERYPATERRRRWCAICGVWTWEEADSGVFRHPTRCRKEECKVPR